jgi:protein-S-isoprenylcysteine O-methyltransferase Ste14
MAAMRRIVVLTYGAVAYVAFVVVFAAMFLFANNLGIVRGIDAPPGGSLAIDLALVAVFGVSHSVLARPAMKRALAAIVPPVVERSTYVLVASATLALTVWQWRSAPQVIWDVTQPALRWAIWAVSGVGAVMIVSSTFLTNHFDLFGLRQVWLNWLGRAYTPVPFVERSLYRHVRHPMMLGLCVWLWATPRMTLGHLVFSAAMTAYILVGIVFEERGLVRELGAPYEDYRRRVPALVPRLR